MVHAKRTQGAGVSRTLYEEIRARIEDGTYAAGTALPSTRALANERGVSRGTVSLVYELLAADGAIESRPGTSSRVSRTVARSRSAVGLRGSLGEPDIVGRPAGRLSMVGQRIDGLGVDNNRPPTPGSVDFVYGSLSGGDFPTLAWMRALCAVERQRVRRLEYEDPRGNLELRLALQTHLSQTRGIVCEAEQILVVNGSQQAIDLCARLLIDPGDRVVVENPGYRMAHHAFEAYGATLQCVDVDSQGLRVDLLSAMGPAQLVYVTPTHQFPLGSFLPASRRHALLEWAAAHRAWIIEDDYDSEYRYAARPEATLQSLDTEGRVIHVGTFSKTLSPQLRLGYMLVPPALVGVFTSARRAADRHSATGPQRALARLLAEGTYDRHLRRIRRLQRERQSALTRALTRHFGDRVRIEGASSGLHLVAWFPELRARHEPEIVSTALEHGVRVYPLSPLFHPTAPGDINDRAAGLVLGYALLELKDIEAGVARLALALSKIANQ